jgi:hypothetical protein
MKLPHQLLSAVEVHLRSHPRDACAALVHTMGAAGMRGMAWAERRLGQLLPDLPQELVPHVLQLRAELRMWPQLSDFAGDSRGPAVECLWESSMHSWTLQTVCTCYGLRMVMLQIL